MAGEENPLPSSLQSNAQAELLDQIDKLRNKGIGRDISLPQLTVCGDQSSGKSSVLEAISKVAFPTNDGLCTRFVTEVTLRRSSKKFASVKIHPSIFTTQEHREKLKAFEFQADLNQLPNLIESAKHVMGLTDDRSFSQDVLELEISGPHLPHLTLVDMPGLIHTANKSQTAEDVLSVNALVDSYMKKPRSINLAVVSANYDVPNHAVLGQARRIDTDGVRTMGIITKPDNPHRNTERERSYIALAKNNDIPFRLGWHVLRNADHPDRMDENYDRDETERSFFANREPWNTLPRSSVGIEALRTRLSRVLFDQITCELPSMITDIESEVQSCRETLERLGPERYSTRNKLRYLLNFSERFQTLVWAGVAGQYNDPFFRVESGEPNRRLRAVIRGLSQEFAEKMEQKGHSREVDPDYLFSHATPRPVQRSQFLREIQELLKESKGRELPGTFNPLLIFDLFVQHSEPWERIAKSHVKKCWDTVGGFLNDIVDHLIQDSVRDTLLREIIDPAMDKRHQILRDKVDELLTPYTKDFPATLNRQFVIHMQELRKKRTEANVEDNPSEEENMDLYAASELLDSMLAYYRVALDVFVDNIEALAVENCLLRGLDEILAPHKIADMDEEELNRLGGESEDSQKIRKDTKEKLKVLEEGLSVCKRHAKRMSSTRTGELQSSFHFSFAVAQSLMISCRSK